MDPVITHTQNGPSIPEILSQQINNCRNKALIQLAANSNSELIKSKKYIYSGLMHAYVCMYIYIHACIQ